MGRWVVGWGGGWEVGLGWGGGWLGGVGAGSRGWEVRGGGAFASIINDNKKIEETRKEKHSLNKKVGGI